jgi:hypothetical protein
MKSLFLMVIDPPLSIDINSWLVVEPTPLKNDGVPQWEG